MFLLYTIHIFILICISIHKCLDIHIYIYIYIYIYKSPEQHANVWFDPKHKRKRWTSKRPINGLTRCPPLSGCYPEAIRNLLTTDDVSKLAWVECHERWHWDDQHPDCDGMSQLKQQHKQPIHNVSNKNSNNNSNNKDFPRIS